MLGCSALLLPFLAALVLQLLVARLGGLLLALNTWLLHLLSAQGALCLLFMLKAVLPDLLLAHGPIRLLHGWRLHTQVPAAAGFAPASGPAHGRRSDHLGIGQVCRLQSPPLAMHRAALAEIVDPYGGRGLGSVLMKMHPPAAAAAADEPVDVAQIRWTGVVAGAPGLARGQRIPADAAA